MTEGITGMNEVGQAVDGFDAPDLTPSDHTEHMADIVANALQRTKLVEVVEKRANLVNQIHLLCRVKQEDERELVYKVIKRILVHIERDGTVEGFIGKEFMLRGGNVVYAWVFSFGCSDLNRMGHTICDAIDEVFPRPEVLESPLMGAGPSEDMGKGKGARPVRG